jgi:protein-S-isoprenylcysteine O-methyltransferase Ste14
MNNHKIVPPIYGLISLLVMLLLYFVVPGPRIIPKPWNLLGLLPVALGLASAVTAIWTFRRAGTSPEPFHEASALVTGGIYRLSRNPIYLGFLLALLGVAVLLRSLTPYLVLVGYVILIERNVIRFEERMLAEKFGAQWAEYEKRTRRWI